MSFLENYTEDTELMARRAVEICDQAMAKDILLYDVRGTSILADFYLICSANSEPHLRSIVARADDEMDEDGWRVRSIQGTPSSHWMVMDFCDILIHVFTEESRSYYRLEELWQEEQVVFNGADLDK